MRTKFNPVFAGTDSSVSVPFTVGSHNGLVATVHLHPNSGFSAPSPPDIYAVIKGLTENTGNFTKNSYQGNFVIAANGSKYALKVTDATLANAFYLTKSANVDGREWSKGSDIERLFRQAARFYQKQHRKSPEKPNLAYEEAMAVVLDKFNTGVTLMKFDLSANNFKPLTRKVTMTKKSNGKTTTTYSDPCAGN